MPQGAIVLYDSAFFNVHNPVCRKTADPHFIFEPNPIFTVMEKLSLLVRMENLLLAFKEDAPLQFVQTHYAELLTELGEFFSLSVNEAWLLCACLHLHTEDELITFKALSSTFKEPVIRTMQQENQLDHLKQKGFLNKRRSRRQRWSEDQGAVYFELREWVVRSLMNNQPIKPKDIKPQDWFDLLYELFQAAKLRDDEDMDTHSLMFMVEDILSNHADMPLFDYVNSLMLSTPDSLILLYCIASHLCGDEEIVLNQLLTQIFDNRAERVRIMQQLKGQQNELVRRQLLGFTGSSFMNYAQLALSESVLNDLSKINISLDIRHTQLSPKQIRMAADIPEKKLYYNAAEWEQIQLLQNALQPTAFTHLVQRLQEKNLPSGLAVLLHGAPGTGKTETVYQLAKQSGRGIMKVDISAIKSAYFGESEKSIKHVFTQYQNALNQLEHAPILLFNEADGLFAQRRHNLDHDLMQTENAIQNIVLDEMENFKGILMATTNRATYLDAAYERRFLFKINFNLPNAAVRFKIWQDSFPELSEANCLYLSEQFQFTGAQIENIQRKLSIQTCLHNQLVQFNDVLGFCRAETFLETQHHEIGFNLNRLT